MQLILKSKRGFTLFELLLVLVLLSTLSLMAMPNWRGLYIRWQIEQATDKLQALLYYARNLALLRGEIELCSSQDGMSCDEPVASGPAVWPHNLILRSRITRQVIYQLPAIAFPLRLIWAASLGRNQWLRFEATGFSAGQQGAFYLCPPPGYESYGRALVILRSGRLRLANDYSKLPSVCH
jgi:prepilin-type N-terminal cleavage/methylation domain-containing protein